VSVAKEGLTADNHFHEHQQDEIISTKEGERMRILTIGALLVLAMVKLLPVNVMAQNTGQCDFLKEPGVTKGLYGLCMAFCEAHSPNDELAGKYYLEY